MKTKEVLKPAIILCVICLVVTALLAGTNKMTRNAISEQNAKREKASQQVVLPGADDFSTEKNYIVGKKSGKTVGYIFKTESKGYGGTVQIMTGIKEDGTVSGVVILSHSETPGLGANAEKPTFRDQYKQKAPEKGFELVKGSANGNGKVQAMTGATITSRAVTRAVNDAVKEFYAVKGGR